MNRHKKIEQFYEDGSILTREYYKNGKLHGSYELYFSNGLPWKKATYVDGKLHGSLFTYAMSGELIKIDHYHRGRLICEKIINGVDISPKICYNIL